jgi:subtilisin family serine protease
MFSFLLLSTLVASENVMVIFEETANLEVRQRHLNSMEENITRTFEVGSLRGYAADLDSDFTASLQRLPEVAFVEKDIPLYLKRSTGLGRSAGSKLASNSCDTQKNVPSWGISRVSQTKLPLDDTYRYTDGEGANVNVYVLDTGVKVTHVEFQGRATFGYNAGGGVIKTDTDGHGTHVAGTIASQHYGVCKECNIISVKVFTDDGDCSASILIKGFEWVMNHFKDSADKGHVINISVGGDPGETSDAMDQAVNNLVAAGVHVVGAAGNENVDACTESPSRATKIISVGATMILTDTTDFFLGGSNFGSCVKILAPGDKIVSLGITSNEDVGVVDSGTSMASPHVAGTLARFVSNNINASLVTVQTMLLSDTLNGVVQGVPAQTVNKLVHLSC